jgi:uncharacterized membrane protein SirB2
MIVTGQYPFKDFWLTLKLSAVVAYIVLGAVALGRDRSPGLRVIATVGAVAALLAVVWIVLNRARLLW